MLVIYIMAQNLTLYISFEVLCGSSYSIQCIRLYRVPETLIEEMEWDIIG